MVFGSSPLLGDRKETRKGQTTRPANGTSPRGQHTRETDAKKQKADKPVSQEIFPTFEKQHTSGTSASLCALCGTAACLLPLETGTSRGTVSKALFPGTAGKEGKDAPSPFRRAWTATNERSPPGARSQRENYSQAVVSQCSHRQSATLATRRKKTVHSSTQATENTNPVRDG